jgi:metal-dependent amidase/aminoacylase/carboxypeptidase family protein
MKTLEKLRDKLNKNAELSGQEKKTNKIINDFLSKTNPDVHLRNVGGYGIIVIYKGKETGNNILLRADIDGLNIPLGQRTTVPEHVEGKDQRFDKLSDRKVQSSELKVQSPFIGQM